MRTNDIQTSRVSSAVSGLVMAELFLVQATIESATVIGGSLSKLRSSDDATQLKSLLQHTRDDALEPFTSRFKYLRELIATGSEETTPDDRG